MREKPGIISDDYFYKKSITRLKTKVKKLRLKNNILFSMIKKQVEYNILSPIVFEEYLITQINLRLLQCVIEAKEKDKSLDDIHHTLNFIQFKKLVIRIQITMNYFIYWYKGETRDNLKVLSDNLLKHFENE